MRFPFIIIQLQVIQQVYDWRSGFVKTAIIAIEEYCSQQRFITLIQICMFVTSQTERDLTFIFEKSTQKEDGTYVSTTLLNGCFEETQEPQDCEGPFHGPFVL